MGHRAAAAPLERQPADSDEAGRLFQGEVGRAFQLDRCHPTDLIPAK
jgi:hypothetical protein